MVSVIGFVAKVLTAVLNMGLRTLSEILNHTHLSLFGVSKTLKDFNLSFASFSPIGGVDLKTPKA